MNSKFVIALAALLNVAPAFARQASNAADHVEHLGAAVMPFDLARSTHVFTALADGGTQDVTSLDGDPAQVNLIRAHLRKEAEAFARGDYADPSSIHGAGMPGLAELRAGAGQISVSFETLPQGARLRFTASDSALVAALHRWFEAQIHDHGGDAIMHRS